MLFQIIIEPLANYLLHITADFGVTELIFGLTLKLGIWQFY